MYDQTKISGYMDSYNETLLYMIWKHKIKLARGLEKTINWYLENMDWCIEKQSKDI